MLKNASIVGTGVSLEEYATEPAERGDKHYVIRAHCLMEILRNAQRWVRGYESPQSKAMEWGAVYDCLLLSPKQWPSRFTVIPADAPRRPSKTQINAKKPSPETIAAIKWWDDFNAHNKGEIVSQDTNASVHAAIKRLKEDELIADLLESSDHQVMVRAEWHDLATGLVVPLKCLIDIVPPPDHPVLSNSLWDSKSTKHAAPRTFRRDAQQYLYNLQAKFYLDLFNQATGEVRSDFGHVVQESYPPYEYRTPPPLLSQRFLDYGGLMYKRALSIYCKSLSSDVWPGYDRRSDGWPITDCDDWFLDMEAVFEPIEENEAEEESESEPETEVIP